MSARTGGEGKAKVDANWVDKASEEGQDADGTQGTNPEEGDEPTAEYLMGLGKAAYKGGKGQRKGEFRNFRFEGECSHCGKWGH